MRSVLYRPEVRFQKRAEQSDRPNLRACILVPTRTTGSGHNACTKERVVSFVRLASAAYFEWEMHWQATQNSPACMFGLFSEVNIYDRPPPPVLFVTTPGERLTRARQTDREGMRPYVTHRHIQYCTSYRQYTILGWQDSRKSRNVSKVRDN